MRMDYGRHAYGLWHVCIWSKACMHMNYGMHAYVVQQVNSIKNMINHKVNIIITVHDMNIPSVKTGQQLYTVHNKNTR